MTVLLTGYSERQALRWLADAVQASLDPILTTDDLRCLLAVCRITDENGNLPDAFDRWTASTEYPVGERVVPSLRNGYVYRVSTPGTSGSSVPTWSTTIDASVTDGTVIWTVEDTAPWVPTYDAVRINRAAGDGWRRKAAKLSESESFSADDGSFRPEERRSFCLEMAAKYDKKGGAGTLSLGGPSQYDTMRSHVVLVN